MAVNKIAGFGLLILSSTLLAFGKPQHSSLAIEQKFVSEKIELSFKVEPKADMAITHDAPWSLSFEPATDVSFEKLDDAAKFTYKQNSYNKDLPGFVVVFSSPKNSGILNYKLKAFICTKDKKRCFPETHSGQMIWKRS